MVVEIQDLTCEEYERIRRLVYSECGINLGEHKMQLVRARLGKLLRAGGYHSFGEYLAQVEKDRTGDRLCQLLDAISTNTTHLFREIRHFQLLGEILKRWAENPAWCRSHSTVRIWSAACSSGDEPYSIAMAAHDALSRSTVKFKILATDISTRILAKAQAGVYDLQRLGTVPPEYRNRYFRKPRANDPNTLEVIPDLRETISFARFNLMSPAFNFPNGFDVVFCRNVMIYFDRPTQQTLIGKLTGQLHAGGYLMIGHSESLNGIEHALSYVEPSVFIKR